MHENIMIQLKNVCKQYTVDGPLAANNVSLDIHEGEFVTLLGPSGCGKTTTLRMIAGFEAPTSGEILLGGKSITEIPPYRRPINTVFQRYALFPHLNVFNNIAFGLKLKRFDVPKKDKDGREIKDKNGNPVYKKEGYSKAEIAERVRAALKMVDLSDYEQRDVDSLSGGQQQRVAIARALINQPKVLLLDEPLGALDLKMRHEMQLELRAMHKRAGITFVYVTHDQEEALTMSDKIVVMKDGIIQQIGTPTEIYNEPANAFVADFIGESNIISGIMPEDKKVKFAGQVFDCVDTGFKKNEPVDVVIRPEDIFVLAHDKQGQISGRVITNIFKGVHYEMGIEAGGIEFLVQDTKFWPAGTDVMLYIMPEDIHIMKKERTVNQFTATVTKDYKINFADTNWDCDLLTLFTDLKMDENETIVDKTGNEFDFSSIEIKVEVGLKDITLTDNIDDGQISGEIVQQIFKGDHWQIAVRAGDGTDFYVDLKDNYDNKDRVGIRINAPDIILKEYARIEEE